MSTTANYFWTRPTADRLAARSAIMAACGDFGESSGEGFCVLLRKGDRELVEAVAADHDLRVVSEYWTVSDGRTLLAVELAG